MTVPFDGEDADEADFTDEDELVAAPLPPILIGDEIAREREKTRGQLALILVGLLVALDAALLVVAVWKVRPVDRGVLALLLTGLLNPVVALVGTVLGFYFGEKAAKGNAA